MASFQILLSLSLSFSRSPAFSSHLSRPSVLSGCPSVFRYNLFFSAFLSVAPFITLRYHLTVDSFYGTTCAGSVFREIADRYRVVRRTDLQISDTSRTLCLSIFLLAFFLKRRLCQGTGRSDAVRRDKSARRTRMPSTGNVSFSRRLVSR